MFGPIRSSSLTFIIPWFVPLTLFIGPVIHVFWRQKLFSVPEYVLKKWLLWCEDKNMWRIHFFCQFLLVSGYTFCETFVPNLLPATMSFWFSLLMLVLISQYYFFLFHLYSYTVCHLNSLFLERQNRQCCSLWSSR